ncbi:MAG: AhpC/TSA family protein [Bacteroidetes bacterium]|jgi:peroxiredoxin|nr:AhpC/TSA family protein [Bacteroidota bacterium]MBT6685642.1 AhpC/TSA family protein [Bacteroidota bacterium]MBT7141866.1 AhpC/TSA family protein [Bacteroidota bacterium]MBT7491057.1 AhpC/TSA family protein [Bacteroidota bacterium]
MKKYLVFVLVVAIFSNCSTDNSNFGVSGNIKNAGENWIFLYDYEDSRYMRKALDSAKIGSDGNFTVKARCEKTTFFSLQKDKSDFILLLINPDEEVKIDADFSNLNKTYSVSGSKESEAIKEVADSSYFYDNEIQKLNKIYQDALEDKTIDIEALRTSLDQRSGIILSKFRNYLLSFIKKNESSLVSLMALFQGIAGRQILTEKSDLAHFENVERNLTKLYPESKHLLTLRSSISQMKQKFIAEEQQKIQKEQPQASVEINTIAPEINLPSPNGENISLHSLRGKYVLLDFWASWCAPCRRENPNLVANYNKYKDEGFEIYQVSLDKAGKRSDWINAIRADKLDWIHVSDLKFWQCVPAKQYGVKSIPSSFLIDKDGKVIAKNLRASELGKKLKQIFNK